MTPADSKRDQPAPDYQLERRAGASATCRVAGVDEVGRGALAGPVVAAAVVLDPLRLPPHLCRAIRDSKLLTPRQRALIAEQLQTRCDIGIGQASAAQVDRVGIAAATLQAMADAVQALSLPPQIALVDGIALHR